ncbi:subtilisin-like protease SBT5.6 [Tripterygium wilfordii]|uniref:subtilisin-like protease SBT5.6 n=1 Tax=Tripterygium wilfordii TaxID=458696 RepID=UPI0018F84E56|nr:subtilisin-like protease SBT5.6 [Tripterygium wilfordii]
MTLVFIFFLILLPLLASSVKNQVYIVYFGAHRSGDKTLHEIEETHLLYLSSVKETEEEARISLVYSYKHSINGFAALLTPDEASKLSELDEVVSVFQSRANKYSLQTTRSWSFLGLDGLEDENMYDWNKLITSARELLSKAKYGEDVIVGIIDSGVWPESKSFSDKGMRPIPESWKGDCSMVGEDFNSSHCNRKIIGARYYIENFERYHGQLNDSEDSRSPRDLDGHGTHTASIAVGRSVRGAAALGGFGLGTASGGAPKARLAVYKVCWTMPNQPKARKFTCFSADILAGIDDAIANGVHVLSISIGMPVHDHYDEDGIAIGALHAIQNNILVVSAAGNSGPIPGSVVNMAPWIITVGASSIDRKFLGPLTLGNGLKLMGQTVTPYTLEEMYPLVYAGDAEDIGVAQHEKGQCLDGTLLPEKVTGKIVLCGNRSGLRGSTVEKCAEVKRAGGVGFIYENNPTMGSELVVETHLLPTIALTVSDAMIVRKYSKFIENATATIGVAKTVLHNKPAPTIAGFSSRGPSMVDPHILKPDLVAPGLNILAAWSEKSSPTRLLNDHRRVKYNIFYGTSMAAPHVAAIASLLKAIHPKWSNAAIKSAIMTTSSMKNNEDSFILDSNGVAATPFALGSGHVSPIKAVDPGLIYDCSYTDYLSYLCSGGFKHINGLSSFDPTFKCPKDDIPPYNLNYPSLALPNIKGMVTISRSVTNVGNPPCVYYFKVEQPYGISVEAFPDILDFDQIGQTKKFTIRITPNEIAKKHHKHNYAFGWYAWINVDHDVRSPIVVSLAQV